MRKPYITYTEIPQLMREYILTVAHAKEIEEIPLPVINDFFEGLHEFYKTQKEEYSEGWIE